MDTEDTQDTQGQPNKAVIAIIVVVLLVVVTAAVVVFSKKQTPASVASNTSTSTTPSTSSSSSSSNASYKDGTYKASGTYQSPGGEEKIDLTISLSGGVITASDMSSTPSTSEAQDYQSRFIDGYKSLVVGKKINDVSLDRVAGSSLTSGGFNDALDQIKSDAQA